MPANPYTCFHCILWLSILCLSPLTPARAQPGCTDAQATNYNPAATQNDGSCTYPLTTYAPALLATLPPELQEISGLTRANGLWWAHADSGAKPEFFRLNPKTGQIFQKISLQNAQNRDWEEVFADSTHLYFGDFGNNQNNRTDLGLYRVALGKIGPAASIVLPASDWQFTPFAYADQTDFSAQPEDSSVYDCEAALAYRGKMHLFTKSRKTNRSVHYVLDETTGKAEKREDFNVEGLITGASRSPDGQVLALLGYDLRSLVPKVFVWLLWDWPADSDLFFSGNKRRIELGTALAAGQAEGIGFAENRMAIICNERTLFNGITLAQEATRALDISAWVPDKSPVRWPDQQSPLVRFSPNPFTHFLQVDWQATRHPDTLRIFNSMGQEVANWKGVWPARFDTSAWPAGTYLVEASFSGKKLMLGRVVK